MKNVKFEFQNVAVFIFSNSRIRNMKVRMRSLKPQFTDADFSPSRF